MQLRHRVALDGVWLDEADDRIMIQKVETGDGKVNVSAVSLWGTSGSRVTSMHRDSIDITVQFALRIKKRDMQAREEVLEKVNAWACAGGWLTTSYKPNRRIRVFMFQAAGAGDPWEWTKVYSIVFRACGVPYWQKTAETETAANTANASLELSVSGSAESVLDVSFLNTSGSTVNSLSIDTGESAMSFSGLGLGAGETMFIDHPDDGKICVLRIRIRSTGGVYRSALNKRIPGSSNDLTVTPGQHTVTVEAGGSGTIILSSCGRYE